MTQRKFFTSIGALLRHYQVAEYWVKGDQVAIYQYYRFRWFSPAEGTDGRVGYLYTGRVTGTVAGAQHVRALERDVQP